MGKGRASVFEDSEEVTLDLSAFAPKPAIPPAPTQEQVKAVSEAANFPSRERPNLPLSSSGSHGATEPAATSSSMPRHPRRPSTDSTRYAIRQAGSWGTRWSAP